MNLAFLLRDLARRLPERPAVTDRTTTLSYAAFAERTARLGGGLRARGLTPGDRVALCMENSGAFLECLFACWTAGLCAVPVNAKLHPREVEHIVRDSGARLLITTEGLAEALAPLADAVPALLAALVAGTAEYDRLARAEAIPPAALEPTDRAWLFYTSGTTGRPKGAMLSHRALLFMAHAYYADIDALGPADVKLHVGPLSHASGLYALPHMLKGGHQVVLPGFDIPAIAAALEQHANVTLFAAPTMLTRLVHSPEAARMRGDRIKTIYYGGGPMYVADLERALTLFGPRLYQLYGQGESPMTITGLDQSAHIGADPATLRSAGVARSGVGVRVADAEDRDLPPGEVGEVLTRSDCMMEAYWNNPAATAETLRGGWLHTGDLGSLDARGFLTLRDRSKDMIISGGSNIYPREIEEVLLRHPDLLEASVIGTPHPDWGEQVVAFVVARPGTTVDPAALDALCLDHIARFKRPKLYRFVETLPKNNYGKVLKTALRAQLDETGKGTTA